MCILLNVLYGSYFNNWTDQDRITVPTLMQSVKGHEIKQVVMI